MPATIPAVEPAYRQGIPDIAFPTLINKAMLKDYYDAFPYKHFMGTEYDRPFIRQKLHPHEGLGYEVLNLNSLATNKGQRGTELRRGKAQQQTVDADYVRVKSHTEQCEIAFTNVLRFATPVDLPSHAKSQLTELFAKSLEEDITDSLTTDLYPNIFTGQRNVAGTLPSFDRVVTAQPIDRATWNGAGSFQELFDGYANPANTGPSTTGGSVALLERATMLLRRGGAENKIERPLKPAFISSRGGFALRRYIGIFSPSFINSLERDPRLANSTFFRGGPVTDPAHAPQTMDGVDYFGRFKGFELYSCNALMDKEFKSANGQNKIGWGIILCASALSIGWAQEPQYFFERDNLDKIDLYYGDEMRGQKLLRYQSLYAASPGAIAGSNPFVEKGAVHVFASLND